MAYSDVHYNIFVSGSTILNNASQNLFGNYGGLSALNQNDVVIIEAQSLNANNYLINASSLSNNSGVLVAQGSPIHLLPMRVRNASTLIAYTATASANGSAMWVAWHREP